MKRFAIVALLAAAPLAACSTGQIIENSVDVAAGTTKVAAKGAVGATRLVYRGGKALLVDDE